MAAAMALVSLCCGGGVALAGGGADDPDVEVARACVDGSVSWSIVRVDLKNSLFVLRPAGGKTTYDGVIRETSVPSLFEHFGVRAARDLVGKSFAAACKKSRNGRLVSRDDPLDVLDLLAVRQMHDGQYIPPDKEVLYRRVVQAFSQMGLPDFSDVDRNTLWVAFQELYDGKGGPSVFVDRLARDVFAASKGNIALLRTKRQELCGECRMHLRLVSQDGKLLYLVIGPYPDPVVADQ